MTGGRVLDPNPWTGPARGHTGQEWHDRFPMWTPNYTPRPVIFPSTAGPLAAFRADEAEALSMWNEGIRGATWAHAYLGLGFYPELEEAHARRVLTRLDRVNWRAWRS